MGTLEGKRILVVDDNLINLDIATESLLLAGALVESASGGAEAIGLIETAKYDAVLLDLTMPGVDGLTVGRAIRASGKNGDTTVLLFTALDTNDTTHAMKEIRAQGLVPKPVDLEQMAKLIARHV